MKTATVPSQICHVLRSPDRRKFYSLLKAYLLPNALYRRVMVKPNWVLHESDPTYPISSMVTSPQLVEWIIDYLCENYSGIESIVVGDVPLQQSDFETMFRQAGYDRLREKYRNRTGPTVSFLDLRREAFANVAGYLKKRENPTDADPRGYTEINLDRTSLLTELDTTQTRYRVSDFAGEETASAHGHNRHRYLICNSVLASDLFINVPKMKTHQKAGITGALKNLIGINGSKSFVAHHREGLPSEGGDEFPEEVNVVNLAQVRVRDRLQKRSPLLFKVARVGWPMIRNTLFGTGGQRRPYIASGAWPGNDTLWRTIYDMNRIVLFGLENCPELSAEPVRQYLAITDGIVAGEGNGPLACTPRQQDQIIVSESPFWSDYIMARLMGFRTNEISQLSQNKKFHFKPWTLPNRPDDLIVADENGSLIPLLDLLPDQPFLHPPGWEQHLL